MYFAAFAPVFLHFFYLFYEFLGVLTADFPYLFEQGIIGAHGVGDAARVDIVLKVELAEGAGGLNLREENLVDGVAHGFVAVGSAGAPVVNEGMSFLPSRAWPVEP